MIVDGPMNERSEIAGGESSAAQTSVSRLELRVQHFSQVCPMQQPKKNGGAGASVLGCTMLPPWKVHSINSLIRDFEDT